ncbi:hypothetical protein Tco_0417488 [Tanacetum coccineum]
MSMVRLPPLNLRKRFIQTLSRLITDDINIISFKNSLDALKDQDDVFETDKSDWQKSNNSESTVNDSDSDEVENVLWEIMGNPLMAWLMMHRRMWRLPPRRLLGKLREDIEEVEHENACSKKS